MRFPSDPGSLVLEQNDICFVFSSDSLQRIAAESKALFASLDGLLKLTSIRKGFVGGGFGGKTSIPKAMATKEHIPGSALIPYNAQLFLGFTSTQRSALGPDRIANFETLPGFTDQWPNGYFRYGTTMHLSHLYEDVDVWYGTNLFQTRVWLATDRRTLGELARRVGDDAVGGSLRRADGAAGPAVRDRPRQRARRAQRVDATGQPIAVRVARQLRGPSHQGNRDRAARRLQHARQPVLLDVAAVGRPSAQRTAAGLHFLAFTPTTDFFRRMRLAMDGRYAGRGQRCRSGRVPRRWA